MPEGQTATDAGTQQSTQQQNGSASGAAGDSGSDRAQQGQPGQSLTQDDIDRIVKERLGRERSKLGGLSFDEVGDRLKKLEEIEASQQSEMEKAVDAARKEADKAARSDRDDYWRTRIVRSEVRALAGGKLNDPADAVNLLDLSSFELDDDGRLDEKKVAAAIDKLLEDKPYLAANGTQRRTNFDAGPRTPAPGGEDMNALLRRAAGRA